MDEHCLQRVDAGFHIELHPSKLANVDEGITEHLNGNLFRYQEDFDGFVMAYDKTKVQSKKASIHPYFPLVHVEVRAQVLLFKPLVGCMLVGTVIKVAADFIGLLVFGVFNASIAADCIRTEFKCDHAAHAWTSRKNVAHTIKVGTAVRFQVVKLQEQSAFFGIFGSLMDRTSGALAVLYEEGRIQKNQDKEKKEKRKEKKDSDKSGKRDRKEKDGKEKKKKRRHI